MDPQHELEHEGSGFTLIEVLIVIVVLGILASVVVFALLGTRNTTYANACPAEGRTLITAAEAYLTTYGGPAIPAANATPDGIEQTLVDADLIRDVSGWYDVDPAGDLVLPAGSPCI